MIDILLGEDRFIFFDVKALLILNFLKPTEKVGWFLKMCDINRKYNKEYKYFELQKGLGTLSHIPTNIQKNWRILEYFNKESRYGWDIYNIDGIPSNYTLSKNY